MAQISSQLYIIQPEYIKDTECSVLTPVIRGVKDKPIYGKGIPLEPRLPGRMDSDHFLSIYLPRLLPLEEYDQIIVLFSGGKDSTAAYYKLLELGVPKHKISLWHHDIDGGNPTRNMDWRCTSSYVKAFAEAEGVDLKISYRKDGFFGELYRVGASKPIEWVEDDAIYQCKTGKSWEACENLRKLNPPDLTERLKEFGYRLKFPAKTGNLRTRWCSAYLKIMVADTLISNLEQTAKDCKILIVSGERRGESVGRADYNEMEIGRTHAVKKNHRLVHQWRAVIDYSEKDVWEVLKRHRCNPHPCYRIGWNRCSCAQCIFSTPKHFAGLREVYPEEYKKLKNDEKVLGFTLDNHCDLDTFVGDAKSLVYHGDKKAMRSILTGEYQVDDVYTDEWHYPAGAFHGMEGGPC